MVGILVAYRRCNLLNTVALSFFQNLSGPLQADINQIVNRSVPRFTLKNLGNIKWTQIHIFCNLVQGYFLCIVVFKIIAYLLHYIFLAYRFKGITFLRSDCLRLLPDKQ